MRRPTAAVLGAVIVLAPVPAAAAGEVPGTYDVTATAVGLSVRSAQSPAASVVTAGLVDATAGFAASRLSSYGTSQSRAAGGYPGDLVAGGPALLCANVLPCPASPPEYPLLADAAYPSRGTASAPGATASAGAQSTQADASVAQQAPPVPVRVDSATAATRAWVDGTGAHAVSRSVVHGLVIGPLRIAAVEAVDTVDVTAAGVVRDAPQLTLTGVMLNGQAASVDDRGVHVAGQDAALPAAQLEAQGLTVRAVGASRQDADGAGRSAAVALLVGLSVPVQGVPATVPGVPSVNRTYVGSLTVAGAGAAVAAGRDPGLQLTTLPAPPAGSAAAQVLPPSALTAPPATGVAGGSQAGPVAGGAPPTVAQPRTTVTVRAVFALADLRTVALALLLLPLASLVAWRAGVRLTRRPS